MKPYYQDDWVTIFHGDCLEIMPELASVDHIITDPPFEVEAHTLQRRVKRERGVLEVEPLDFIPMDERTRDTVCLHAKRMCRGWFLAFCQIEAVTLWRGSIEEAAGTYKRSCIWVKPDGMPQYSGDRPGMGYETFVCGWFGPGKSEWNGGGKTGVFIYNKNEPSRFGHPTQKPQELMLQLITLFSNAGQTVLDPFCGSGSTLRACKDTGRKSIGIELDEKYCEIAANRMKQEVLSL
jgi:site-specific DNA-methyltransferase (adenine-specific)